MGTWVGGSPWHPSAASQGRGCLLPLKRGLFTSQVYETAQSLASHLDHFLFLPTDSRRSTRRAGCRVRRCRCRAEAAGLGAQELNEQLEQGKKQQGGSVCVVTAAAAFGGQPGGPRPAHLS